MRGTVLSPTRIFWQFPEAIDVGRDLFGVVWNPDDCTVEEAEEIGRVLFHGENTKAEEVAS